MPIKIRSGNKTVLDSGSFMTFGPEETVLELSYSGEPLTIRLRFEQDESGKIGQVGQVVDSTTLLLTIKNLNSPLPAYPNDPINIGSLGGHELWLRWAITSLTEAKAKLVQYTFFLGPPTPPPTKGDQSD